MNGDDIKWVNTTMPEFPKGMPFWQRVTCLLGYHKAEKRQTAPGHCYGFETAEGKLRGIRGIHDKTPMSLRDQCGRCGVLL
jgi:hypothetical protein